MPAVVGWIYMHLQAHVIVNLHYYTVYITYSRYLAAYLYKVYYRLLTVASTIYHRPYVYICILLVTDIL